MKSKIREFVSNESSIRDALNVINSSDCRICVTLDKDEKLFRTITDGDIRRALLNNLTLESKISKIKYTKPIFCKESDNDKTISILMKKNGVSVVVRVNTKFEPIELVHQDKIQSKLYLSPPHIGIEEEKMVHEVLESNWIAPIGPQLKTFEKKLAKESNRDFALAVSSGTAALHLALRVIKIKQGDLIYVSDLTFIASVYPILYERAKPVFIDSDPLTWNMSANALERKLREAKKLNELPKLIIVVHIYGQSSNMKKIVKLSKEYGIPIVEDAAESLGAKYFDKPSGSHGLMSIFSFNGNKIITTSGGGALVSNNKYLLDEAEKLSTQGRDQVQHYQHREIAYNYRLSNVLAGIGIGQLNLLKERVTKRRKIFSFYKEGLSKYPGISFQEEEKGGKGSRWLSVIRFDPKIIKIHPYVLLNELSYVGIDARPAWKPMHLQPIFKNFEIVPHSDNEISSSKIFYQSLCLPSGSAMTRQQQATVIKKIKSVIKVK